MSLRNKSLRQGIERKKITQLKFFKLAERFRKTTNRRDTKCSAMHWVEWSLANRTQQVPQRLCSRPFPIPKYRIGVVPSCFRNIDMNALGLL